jgi:hypothetical protein
MIQFAKELAGSNPVFVGVPVRAWVRTQQHDEVLAATDAIFVEDASSDLFPFSLLAKSVHQHDSWLVLC